MNYSRLNQLDETVDNYQHAFRKSANFSSHALAWSRRAFEQHGLPAAGRNQQFDVCNGFAVDLITQKRATNMGDLQSDTCKSLWFKLQLSWMS